MFTLIVIVFGAQVERSHIDGFRTLDECRAKAQLVTGDHRRNVETIFESPSGRAIAYCRPTK